MQLPVVRIHSDRAKEFSGGKFQKWCRDRDLYHTMSPGDEPQSNARAEREVGMVKARMRTALRAGGAPDHFWPLAFRFGVEQRHRQQLQALGIQCPKLLPFGCKAIARRKTWHQRADPFRWPTLRVKLWGPASGMTASSNGYFVEDPEGKFFRSTVVFTHADEVVPSEEGAGQEQDRQSGKILQQEHPMVPGSLPGGEETVDAQGHTVDSGEDEKEKGNDKAKYIQDAINNFEVLVEKANDKGVLAIAPHDQPKRRYLTKRPPRIEGGNPVVYKMEAKDGDQRGSKTGAPDTAKDGNQRGSKTGAPDTGKDRNQRGSKTGAPDTGKDGNQRGSKTGAPDTGKDRNQRGSKTGAPDTGKDGNQRGSETGAPDIGKDRNQRGSKTGAPDTGKDGNQRGSKTGAPDTGKDRNQRGSKTGAPDTGKDRNQRGSKTGAPDTGKDGNQRGSKTGVPDTGKDRNQS